LVPPRCTRLQWSYRTDPVADSTFTPLYITRKAGMQEGVQVEAKTWKVMFDPKSSTYLLPDELKNLGT
jgi:competence transcription factor ComK